MAGWSSLPNDLVNEISSRLLAADDIDYYMEMRVVCRGWYAAMAAIHPKANPADPRFRLRQWVMLDEQYPAEISKDDGDTPVRLFVNTTTGRFVFKELPCLKECYFITSSGGLLVLASKRAPHYTYIFNPFTDSSIRFTAAIPDSVRHTKAYIHGVGPSLNLLLDDGPLPNTAYLAQPNDDLFTMVEYNLLDKVRVISGLANDHEMIDDIINSITSNIPGDMHYFYPPVYHIVESAGEKLLVIRRERPARGVDVFKVDTQKTVIYPVRSIGNRALFLGERCVCVDASKFPSIDGNCVFYLDRGHPDNEGTGIYMYDLSNEKEVWISSGVVDFSWGTEKYVTSSMIQVLIKYSIDMPWCQARA